MESKDRDGRWKKTGKKIISYFKYAAKQCTIHVLETGSKHIPLLTKQRNFIRRIVVRYFSNIIKVPFWPSFEDMRQRLWLLFKKNLEMHHFIDWKLKAKLLSFFSPLFCYYLWAKILHLFTFFVPLRHFWRWEYHDRHCSDSVYQIFD